MNNIENLGASSFATSSFRLLMDTNEWVTFNNNVYKMKWQLGFYCATTQGSKKFNDELWYWFRHHQWPIRTGDV